MSEGFRITKLNCYIQQSKRKVIEHLKEVCETLYKHNYIIRWRLHNLPWILYIIHQLLRDFVSMERNKKELDQKSNSSQYCPQASFKQDEIESEIENENEINEEHKYTKNKFKNTKQGEKTVGSWSLEQNIKYLKFLQRNKEWIKCPLQRRRKRIFQKMYRKIKTRTAGQCRSHHQKSTKKHPEIEMLIDELKVKIANYKYQIVKQMWEKKKQTEQKISIQTTAKQTNINQQFVVAKLGQKLYIQIKASYIKEW